MKALQHVKKAAKVDIEPCTAVIDKYHKVLYDQLFSTKNTKKKNNNEEFNDLIDWMITSHNAVTAMILGSSKKSSSTKRSGSFNSSTISSKKQKSFLETGSIISQQSSIVSSSGDKDKTVQRLLYDGPNPSGESRCTMAVADMIHGCGLPFTLASHPKFRKVLQLAKVVGSNYKPPNRQAIAGPLLDLNYDAYMKKIQEELQKEINEFGVAFYGDGATVKKMPLINILASGVHLTSCVLEIVNCTQHLEAGGKKDARYIASLFRPHIDTIEEQFPNSVDAVYFDGASNVQKAGEVLAATYPRIVSKFFTARNMSLVCSLGMFSLVPNLMYSIKYVSKFILFLGVVQCICHMHCFKNIQGCTTMAKTSD